MSVINVSQYPGSRKKLILFIVFGLATVFVAYGKNQDVFDPNSAMARHYAPGLLFLLIHAFFAALALLLGAFQLSNRLRARYLGAHRVLDMSISLAFSSHPRLQSLWPSKSPRLRWSPPRWCSRWDGC